jgi:hypothetical protein
MNNDHSKEKQTKDNSRRTFIRNAATAMAGFYIVPRHVLGGKGYIAPSDKLNLAGVGIGGKGDSDITNAYNKGENNVVALCDVDWVYAKDPCSKIFKRKKIQRLQEDAG